VLCCVILSCYYVINVLWFGYDGGSVVWPYDDIMLCYYVIIVLFYCVIMVVMRCYARGISRAIIALLCYYCVIIELLWGWCVIFVL